MTPPQPVDSSEEAAASTASAEADAPRAANTTEAESPTSGDSTTSASKEPPRRGRPGWRLGAASETVSEWHARAVNRLGFRTLTAVAISAAATLCVVLAFWLLAGPSPGDERADALAARMTVLEMKIADVARKPLAASDSSAPEDLAARLARLEQAIGGLATIEGRVARVEQGAGATAALDARIARLEKAPPPQTAAAPNDQALTDRIAALEAALGDAKGRADAAFDAAQKNLAPNAVVAADHRDIDALATRVAALEQATKGADERIARAATTGTDKAGRLAFVALVLRTAVERGDPFVTELAAVKPLVTDPAQITPLEPFASTGVPRGAALARELSQLAGPMLNATGAAPREAGIFDRLQQGAEKLVRIRPINETPGDDPATVISRAEVKAANGDLAGALADLSRLPDAVRAPVKDWMKKAEAQIAALAAVRRLADNAVGGLAKP
ncbi:MAG: COG4223 family protein [Candidatus Binataceae bacterium]